MLKKIPFLTVLFACLILAPEAFSQTPRVEPTFLDSVDHKTTRFTQGLTFDGNDLIESTGLYGKSGLYRCTLKGDVLDSVRLEERYFGEGSVILGDDIFYLTWKSHKAFIYNRKPFKLKGEFRIPTEGWGLTLWHDELLMSNGSDELLRISPSGFYVTGVIHVKDAGRPLNLLNELEAVGDTLYANVWQTDLIAVISLPSGDVIKYLDFSKKSRELRAKNPEMDVLNGIAYDGKNFWVTGKLWPKMYKISF